jgi:DNA-binding CsgD family transcriptional regulator
METAVVALLARGMHARDIARELGISKVAVGNHLTRASRKLGCANRVQIAEWFNETHPEELNAPK